MPWNSGRSATLDVMVDTLGSAYLQQSAITGAGAAETAASGGARVFAARGKRLCCRPPPPSDVFRSLKRYISSVHFQKFSNLAYFFTVNISSTFFSHPKVPRRRVTPLDTPRPSNQIGILIFLWLQGDNGVDCEQYAKLSCI